MKVVGCVGLCCTHYIFIHVYNRAWHLPIGVRGSHPRTKKEAPNMCPKRSQDDPKLIPKLPQNDPKTVPKRSHNDPQTIPKRSQHHPKTIPTRSQNYPQHIPKRPQNDPKTIPKLQPKPYCSFLWQNHTPREGGMEPGAAQFPRTVADIRGGTAAKLSVGSK